MKLKSFLLTSLLLPALTGFAASPGPGYAKGADVGWLSQLEAQGHKFYTPDAERKEMECMKLLRDYCGVNSIRLRVWVNPKNGWNSIRF